MSVTNDLRELLQRYPYPHRLPDVLEAVQAHAAMLQAGYARIMEQAQATQASHVARYDVWAFMACDMALERAQKAGTALEAELAQVIRESGTN